MKQKNNNKQLIIYSDLHLGASHSVGSYQELIELKDITNVYLLGDIIDMRNVKKRHIKRWERRIRRLELKFGDHYIAGNHECKYKIDNSFNSFDGITLTHGHILDWTNAKVQEWQKSSGGKGKFGRFFYAIYKVGIMRAKKKSKPYTPSNKLINNVDFECRYRQSNALIMGHKHHTCDITTPQGNRFITVGRGKTEINL